MLNSRNIGEAGPRDLIDDPDDDSDLENSYDRNRASNGGATPPVPHRQCTATLHVPGGLSRPDGDLHRARRWSALSPVAPLCTGLPGFDKLGTARGAKEDPKDKRTTAHKIKVHDVRFCPSGHGWGTATTEVRHHCASCTLEVRQPAC